MPTYSYACTQCDNAFDIVQSFTDESLTECSVCGGRLRKVYGSVGVTFKGSGFYRNDSRSSGGAKSNGASREGSADSSSSSTGSQTPEAGTSGGSDSSQSSKKSVESGPSTSSGSGSSGTSKNSKSSAA